MTIIRGSSSTDQVVVILRAAAQDEELSYRARGLLLALMSRPPDWKTNYRRLTDEAREGQRAVRMALRELQRRGYLHRARVHNGRGFEWSWAISDSPGLAALKSQKRSSTKLQPTKVKHTDQQPTEVQPTEVQPTEVQPTEVQPTEVQPTEVDTSPRIPELERETERETPPPTPGRLEEIAAAVGGLEVVVAEELQRTATAKPGRRPLTNECRRLMHLGWSPDQLRTAIRTHDWSGARAGAVIAWLRDLTEPPRAGLPRQRERPAHCGSCDPASRLVLDDHGRPRRGQPCPECHPDRQEIPA